MIIHLKRFQYTKWSRDKITVPVDYPIESLCLDEFVVNPEALGSVYDLYAVAYHSGGLGGGHYTASALNYKNGQWYHFNDSSVHRIAKEEAVSSSAYVLFYRRRAQSLLAAPEEKKSRKKGKKRKSDTEE